MMRYSHGLRRIARVCLVVFALAVLLLTFRSLMGLLLLALLLFGWFDYVSRRNRAYLQTLNSALLTVCAGRGEIAAVARAFARSGPYSLRCRDYADRLDRGEEPLQAAVEAGVPLQMETAIGMQGGGVSLQIADTQPAAGLLERSDWVLTESAAVPAYGQIIYLAGTALITSAVLAAMALFVTPTIVVMLQEFEVNVARMDLLKAAPSVAPMILIAVLLLAILPALNRGRIGRFRLPRWLPMLPRRAQRRADFLKGLAAGFDAGWPIGRSLAISHAVSHHSGQRWALQKTMQQIESGGDPIDAMRAYDLLDDREAAWMRGASGPRTAQLLRTMAEQNTRDARANLMWAMEIIYPLSILLLGATALAFMFVFFDSLQSLIDAQS